MAQQGSSQDFAEGSREAVLIPGYNTLQDFTKEGFKLLGEAIRNSNGLPVDRDWDFHKTSDVFKSTMNDESNSVLRLMNQIMQSYDIDSNIRSRVLDDRNELVVEVNDVILDRAGTNFDEVRGIRRTMPVQTSHTVSQPPVINGAWNRLENLTLPTNERLASNQQLAKLPIDLVASKNIERPQSTFKTRVNNSRDTPWEPRLIDKPNSLKPLAIFLEECEGRHEFSHPYEFELDRFEPSAEQLRPECAQPPKPINLTPLVEINEPEQLNDLLDTLRKSKEFAVDLEHHSYRTFMGITCLMQISTDEKDYLIDTLKLRDDLHILNEVFTNKSIVKVFHGADSDIQWLQRDLSIYVVNMFDTHQAAKLLNMSKSLAYLLKFYCDVVANKQYQMADWRIRPLPDELKEYARTDTHYLLHIYKCLKNQLLSKGNGSDQYLLAVYKQSTEVCKKRYFKPFFSDTSHLDIYRRCRKMFDNRQMYALKEIFNWRDAKAREEDESLAYVLPNHMLLRIAETLPREMQGVLACCSPIPPLVRVHLLELHKIVLRAREQSLEKPIFKEVTAGRGVLKTVIKVDMSNPLHCPHDLSHTEELSHDLPTALKQNILESIPTLESNIEKKNSRYSIFNDTPTVDVKPAHSFQYFSPYERYKLVKPFVIEEERMAKEKEQTEEKTEAVEEDKPQPAIEEPGDGAESSDAERIASIREHYMKMSKKFSAEQQEKERQAEAARQLAEKSLVELGASKKRKRDSDVIYMGPVANNSLETPRPFERPQLRANKKYKNRGKKRKFQDTKDAYYQQQNQQQSPLQNPRTQHNQPKQSPNKNNNKQQAGWRRQNQNPQNSNHNSPQQQKQNQQNGPKRRKTVQGQQNQKNDPQNQQQNRKQQQQQRKAANRNRNKPPEFVPYDYTSVDFRQFQGGGGSASKGPQMKPQFKAKGKRNVGRVAQRSTVFRNTRKGNAQ